jgi:hypothetical protein
MAFQEETIIPNWKMAEYSEKKAKLRQLVLRHR